MMRKQIIATFQSFTQLRDTDDEETADPARASYAEQPDDLPVSRYVERQTTPKAASSSTTPPLIPTPVSMSPQLPAQMLLPPMEARNDFGTQPPQSHVEQTKELKMQLHTGHGETCEDVLRAFSLN